VKWAGTMELACTEYEAVYKAHVKAFTTEAYGYHTEAVCSLFEPRDQTTMSLLQRCSQTATQALNVFGSLGHKPMQACNEPPGHGPGDGGEGGDGGDGGDGPLPSVEPISPNLMLENFTDESG